MVGKETGGQPISDDVVNVLFERFCQRCELGENGCVQIETKAVCPAFYAIQFLLPDNPFVFRIMGRITSCPKCQQVGLAPPTSAFNAPKQPILACQSCGAPFWKGQYGMLVDKFEDINKTFAFRFVDSDGKLELRSVDEDNQLERLWDNDEHNQELRGE